jgi:hypothetical protein
MAIKEKFKYIELGGRKWVIGKFDALTGSYIAAKLMATALPKGMEQQMNMPNLPKGRSFMSREEFQELQIECLKVCYEDLPAGKAPVMGANNAWGVADIEDDMVLVISLTIHALIHNVAGFFEGNALKDLLTSFKGMKLAGVKI